MAREDYLFTSLNWHEVDHRQRQQMAAEIESFDADRLLNTSVDDLTESFAAKFQITVPGLNVENLVVESHEKQIDVSCEPMGRIISRGSLLYVTGTEIRVEIPFTGEARVFKIRPNPYTLNPPRGTVCGSNLTFSIIRVNLDKDSIRREIDSTVASIQSYLVNLRGNVSGLNGQLLSKARAAIEARRSKLLASRNMVASLGFKMKERDGVAKTFVAPEVRRKITPVMPPASTAPYRPEPALSSADYEHILGVMQSMAQIMELSPSTFHDCG